MPTKDRLDELKQKRQNASLQSQNTLLNDHKNNKQLCSIDEIYKKVDNINILITKVDENAKICEEILSGKQKNSKSDKNTVLEETFRASELLCFKISKELKAMKEDLKESSAKNNAEFRILYLQYSWLNERFRNSVGNHQSCVQKHKDIRKELLEKSAKIVGDCGINIDDESEKLLGQQNQIFVGNYLMEVNEVKRQLTDLTARHNELLAIEEHLVEIRDLFIEMAILVEQQQEGIDRIEHHASIATDYVESTVVNLDQASKKKKSHTKMCIILWIVAGFLVLIIILGLLY